MLKLDARRYCLHREWYVLRHRRSSGVHRPKEDWNPLNSELSALCVEGIVTLPVSRLGFDSHQVKDRISGSHSDQL